MPSLVLWYVATILLSNHACIDASFFLLLQRTQAYVLVNIKKKEKIEKKKKKEKKNEKETEIDKKPN